MQNVLQDLRDGRAAARQLKSLAANNCLTDRDFDRLIGKIENALTSSLGPDPVDAKETPAFHVLNGGRK